LQRDVDLIEEVVRAHGVGKIGGTDRSRFTPSSAADRSHDLEVELRERLVARRLAEARTSKLIPRSAIGENASALRNPLSEDHVALRPSLLAGLLAVVDRNVRAGAERVAIFELGRVFIPPDGTEERRLGILLWGNLASAPHWRTREKRQLDFVDLKGAIESLGIPHLSFCRGEHADLALAAEILLRDRRIGFAGQLSAARKSIIDAPGAVFVAELNVDLVLHAAAAAKTFREIERFPAVRRDIAMIVPEKLSHAEIVDVICAIKEPLLESVELFDLFTGELGEARKSLAYRLTYRDRSRTLTGEEVAAAHVKIRARLQRELGAELRE
jgi:phenylalanyl-tRNA synthetase beta chain